jgi:hypothetical protein
MTPPTEAPPRDSYVEGLKAEAVLEAPDTPEEIAEDLNSWNSGQWAEDIP